MLQLIRNKPRRQGNGPWRSRKEILRRGRFGRSLSVKSLLLLATLLFGGAALLVPYVDIPSDLPRVHRHGLTEDKPSSSWLPGFGGDVDCAGGGGNGPNFVYGPVRVAPGDPHGLDRDGDGIGCEPR